MGGRAFACPRDLPWHAEARDEIVKHSQHTLDRAALSGFTPVKESASMKAHMPQRPGRIAAIRPAGASCGAASARGDAAVDRDSDRRALVDVGRDGVLERLAVVV